MKTALILIDIQNEYFPGGKRELSKPEPASLQARRLLDYFRAAGLPVAFVQHLSVQPGAAAFLPNTPGADIHPSIQPRPGETIIQKHYPNSFRETTLLAYLHNLEVDRLVISGMMTHMCVDTTVRAANDLGFTTITAADACATRDLTYAAHTVPASEVHTAFLAALNGMFGQVLKTDQVLALLESETQPA